MIKWLNDWLIDLIWFDLIDSIDWIDLTWFGLMWLIWFDLICLDAQLGTYQPPIPKTYQASAWSYLYIGRLMCKTECSPIGLRKKFVRSNSWKIPRQKVVDFVPLGTLFGPGPPDPDLALVNTPNSLKFRWFCCHFDPWAQEIIRIP